MRPVALVIAAALLPSPLGGCEFAVQHPAPTAAIVGGTIALGTCELQGAAHTTCGVAMGSVALAFGILAAVAMWATDRTAPEPLTDYSPAQGQDAPIIRKKKPTPAPEPAPRPAAPAPPTASPTPEPATVPPAPS